MRKKLIEVALPLEEINKAAAREKSIRHGHPSTLHLWWARRPLAACRAVLFAQLVDDPSSHPDKFPTEETQEQERKRLFGIIENLVKWENSNKESVLVAAREEILKSCDGNALASSVVLACRQRRDDAPLATRREFINALRNELPTALKNLQHGSIAPVNLAQAAIGPGMAVFSRYSKVLETDGSPMRVRSALGLINQALDEILAEQEGEYDAETRWALAWFEQYGITEGKFGDAETLSRAKDTAVNALEEAGIIKAKAGKVQLVARDQLYPPPFLDMGEGKGGGAASRFTIWQLTQHLIRALHTGGETAAARIIRRVGSLAESAKDLAYRLYVICDRKGWPQEAHAYDMLVKSWPELQRLAASSDGESARLL